MNHREQHAPVLIFAYGNPSRGDDALGPAMFGLLEKCKQESRELDEVDLLTDFQLQIEHAVDLEHRRMVIFVDAGVSCAEPYEFDELRPGRDDSYTTHAMSPASVLDVYSQIHRSDPPPAYMLTIRGYSYELGQDMSGQAETNLQQAFEFIRKFVAD